MFPWFTLNPTSMQRCTLGGKGYWYAAFRNIFMADSKMRTGLAGIPLTSAVLVDSPRVADIARLCSSLNRVSEERAQLDDGYMTS